MDLFLKILAASALGMMAFYAWRGYQYWQKEGAKAQKGDWAAAILPLVLVAGLVVLLVAFVRA